MQSARDRKFVKIDRRNCLRRKKRERVNADDDGHIEGLAAALRHLIEHVGVAWQQQGAEPIGTAQLQAVERHILHTSHWIACDTQSCGDISAVVMLIMCRQRQLLAEVDLAMHDLLHRRGLNLHPWQRIKHRVLETRQYFT